MIEHPDDLARRLNLGREEYLQRLLTMLIVDGAYPKWNSRTAPSSRGRAWFAGLATIAFGEARIGDDAIFVDEFELKARGETERGGAPDHVLLHGQRLWIIELKTERASHRPGQLDGYVDLAHHHYPTRSLDVTYLTPRMDPATAPAALRPGERYAHVYWPDLSDLVARTWSDVDGNAAAARETILRTIEDLDHLAPRRPPPNTYATDTGHRPSAQLDPIEVARTVASDGEQRAIDQECDSLDALYELRDDVRNQLAAADEPALANIRPWIWRAATSGGAPLTDAGRTTGYEIRLSRYRPDADSDEGS